MFPGLDHFEQVNNVHNQPAGGRLLKEVASRLAQSAHEDDNVGRNRDDEFLHLLMNPQARNSVWRISAAVIKNLSRTLVVGNSLLSVRPSIEITIYPGGGVNDNELIDYADAAMYRAKQE